MGLTIDERHMSSDATSHTATWTGKGWTVSWLPERTLNRNQAISTMMIADTLAEHGDSHPPGLIATWAAEVGMDAEDAIDAVTRGETTR